MIFVKIRITPSRTTSPPTHASRLEGVTQGRDRVGPGRRGRAERLRSSLRPLGDLLRGDGLGRDLLGHRRVRLEVVCRSSNAGSSASAAGISATTLPPKMTIDSVTDELDLLELGRVHQDGSASLGEVAQQA